MFKSGSEVSVFSPSTENSTVATTERDPHNSPVSFKESARPEQSKPAVIIVTKTVKEGDAVPSLPS